MPTFSAAPADTAATGTAKSTAGLAQIAPGIYTGSDGKIVNIPMSAQGASAAAPFGTDDYGNPFGSTAQAADWKQRVAARDLASRPTRSLRCTRRPTA